MKVQEMIQTNGKKSTPRISQVSVKPATRVAVASGLTLPSAQCRSAGVAAWKTRPVPVANDTPAVYAIGA